jgi:4-amino-4-deoxy-L-arabinose transferase-like glycosyltransferase
VTRGPARHPLEAVAMLSMALPIAMAGAVHAARRRQRILYGVAAGVLVAAILTTDRKSALLVPLAVVLLVAYFRRRELLRLAPLALPLLVAIQIMSPGALASIGYQFKPDHLGANTVSDRTADYDAVRPDVWSHFALGRGWGSYQPPIHRVLDSDVLSRVVETGVVGLAAFVLMGLCVVLCARAPIRSRHPTWAPIALAGAGSAVAFLVVATLFDEMAFPHAPYIFLSMAALLAVILKRGRESGAGPP